MSASNDAQLAMNGTVNTNFGNDGTFFVSLKEFVEVFRALNICKVGDWEELRVKGEFTSNL